MPQSACASGPADTDCRTSSAVIAGWPIAYSASRSNPARKRTTSRPARATSSATAAASKVTFSRAARVLTHRCASASLSIVPQSTTCATFSSSCTIRRRRSIGPQTKTIVACAGASLMNASRRSCSASDALLSRFGISNFSASATTTTRRGTIIGSVLAASMSASTFASPPYNRSTLKARRSSSTISANSAATEDFSRSSAPTSMYSGSVSPAASCLRRIVVVRTGNLERLENRGHDRTSHVGSNAIERAALLIEQQRVEGGVGRARRQLGFLAEGHGIVRPQHHVGPRVGQLNLHRHDEEIARRQLTLVEADRLCRDAGDLRR